MFRKLWKHLEHVEEVVLDRLLALYAVICGGSVAESLYVV
jgi:hypothetical protein